MHPFELKRALDALRWSQRGLADVLDCDDRLVRRWISGDFTIPEEIAEWLTDLAALHSTLPPPTAWRRRVNVKIEGGYDPMSDEQRSYPASAAPEGNAEPSFSLQALAWDWQPGGYFTARGKLSVTRAGDEAGPVTLAFELPFKGALPPPATKNPQEWIVASLRRALRR